MEDTVNDPLSQLVIDADELDRQKLTELLNGYCVIAKDGQIRAITNFPSLDTTSKIVAILLAQKAVNALGFSDTDQISPKQIELISGLPGSTVRGKLGGLREQRVVESINGKYSIPNHSILHIALNTEERSEKDIAAKKRTQGPRKKKINSESLEKLLQVEQNQIGTKRLSLLLHSGKYLERALAVLAIAREIGVESLSPSDITQFLKEKIRIKVIRENISLALGRGTKYVDRFRLGHNGAYGYKIMLPGEKLLEEALASITES